MAKSRAKGPDDGISLSHRRSSPFDLVHDRIFQLQSQAISALPEEWPGDGTLPGRRVPADERLLRQFLEGLGPSLEDLEAHFLPRKPKDKRHFYLLLYFLMSAAHFIGSRARVSESQRNYFASKLGAKGGSKSGQSRKLEARETWQPHALALARAQRRRTPKISKEDLAKHVRCTWSLKIDKPAHRTLVNFLASAEKNGRLTRKNQEHPKESKSPLDRFE